jgi:hypothetical protein
MKAFIEATNYPGEERVYVVVQHINAVSQHGPNGVAVQTENDVYFIDNRSVADVLREIEEKLGLLNRR